MRIILTVDVEADTHTTAAGPHTLRNLESLPRFQEVCQKYGFAPTYLVSYEAICDSATAARLCEWQRAEVAEVGAHLHPWTTPPASPADERMSFPSELSDHDLRAKFAMLTETIAEAVGRKPTSYRSGRWGFDSRQAELLAEHGYTADCSITPKVDWRRMGGPDFRRESLFPHRLPSGILEVPMTILCTGIFRKENNAMTQLYTRMPDGFFKKICNFFLFRQKWLRIFPSTIAYDWERIYRAAKYNDLPVMMFMIHSTELHLGTSSYTKTEPMVEHMYQRLEELLKYLQNAGVGSSTVSEFAKV